MLKILCATDGSDDAAAARRLLQALPLPAGTRVHVLSVMADVVFPVVGGYADGALIGWQGLERVRETEAELAREAVTDAARELSAPGTLEVTTEVRDGDAAREIIAGADAIEADLVVVGSKGLSGLEGFLLGSVARNVAKHCRRPVLVARAPRNALREVIVATDGSEHARHAVRFASTLPLPEGTQLTTVHVVRPYAPFPGLLPTDREEFDTGVEEVRERQRTIATALAAEAKTALATAGRRVQTEVREGDPATQILSLAEELQADLIVAGARGASLIEGLFVGSVADRLLKEARCSMLIVH